MIELKLREAMALYSQKHGKKLTYQQLAEMTGISKSTLEAIGSRPDYNTTLAVLDTLCRHLDCSIFDLVAYHKGASMTEFNLYDATGLTPKELAEVFQYNPRAYMAVRGAVAEKHLEKVLENLKQIDKVDDYRSALDDTEKDFYLQVDERQLILECKNVEVIKTVNKRPQLSYIEYLAEQGYLSTLLIEDTLKEIGLLEVSLENLSAKNLNKFFKRLPKIYRESGLVKYQYSVSKVQYPKVGQLPDKEYINQFSQFPMTIDFQKTRNSTDEDGDTRRNRYYKVGEIDIVAACLFSRNMEWKFLYAEAQNFDRHDEYPDRYSNKLKIKPGLWTSNLMELISN